MQREDEIWKCLESLIENSPVTVKKEIIKLLDFENNPDKLKYLLDLYDDDNWEIRSLAIEKLSSLKNLDLIDTNNKVKLLFIGLSDKNEKVKSNTRIFFKNYLNFLGIITNKNEKPEENKDSMAIDENVNDLTFRTNKVKLEDEDMSQEDEFKVQTADEKIDQATSPLRLKRKRSIKLSPAILFEKLNFLHYYFNPKYSFVFQLVTDALIDNSSYESIIEVFEGIINHLMTSSNTQTIVNLESGKKRALSHYDESSNSLVYEVIFLQSK